MNRTYIYIFISPGAQGQRQNRVHGTPILNIMVNDQNGEGDTSPPP